VPRAPKKGHAPPPLRGLLRPKHFLITSPKLCAQPFRFGERAAGHTFLAAGNQPLRVNTPPRYEFTDTNAPAEPQQLFRLRWP